MRRKERENKEDNQWDADRKNKGMFFFFFFVPHRKTQDYEKKADVSQVDYDVEYVRTEHK